MIDAGSALASYLINWDCNLFLDWLAWLMKKTRQINQSYIATDMAALMVTLSVMGPYLVVGMVGGIARISSIGPSVSTILRPVFCN